MNWLPDVVMLGQFPLAISALTALAGGLTAYLLAGWSARRTGLDPGAPQDLVLDLVVGGLLGAKLVYVLLDLPGYLANPLTLVIFPYGPLALPAGAAGAAAAAAWGLRRRRNDTSAILDAAAAPLLAGAALAAAGWKGPGAWAYAPLLGLAAAAAFGGRLAPSARRPGTAAARTLTLAACAAVLADLARPAAPGGLPGGVSLYQAAAALLGTGAWLWTRK